MKHPPSADIHLCIIQPAGYVHSLGLLDAAHYFRHQFTQMAARVTIAKNRLRHDVPNLVFGAHLGFDPALTHIFCCIFVNLEQLGPGGSTPPEAYLALLKSARVIDYDAGNPPGYGQRAEDVPLVSFGFAPYLAPSAPTLPLDQRPIDLLFFGSINERRRQLIERIEKTGRTVVTFDAPVYGPERDAFIVQSRAVLNCHHYDSARFEQVRAFQVLSLGTPLVSERTARTHPGPAFENSVNWFTDETLDAFFAEQYPAPDFVARAQEQLQHFRKQNPIAHFAHALEFARAAFGATRSIGHPVQPTQQAQRLLHIGSGKDYRPGWLNVDVLDSAQPDIRLDLSRPHTWPVTVESPFWGTVRLQPGATELIFANNVLEHVPDLPTMMGNCLALLRVGGKMVIEVPHESSPGAWQDPTHVRAMNENSWIYYTDWFWYLGWFEHRFALREFQWLDANHARCERPNAAFMTVTLEKVPTTIAERMTARTMRPDFGGLIAPVTLPPGPRLVAVREPAPKDAAAAPSEPRAPEPAPRPAPQPHVLAAQPDVGVVSGTAKPASAPADGSTPAGAEDMREKLLARLPAAATVIEFGCGDGTLGARYKVRHPNAHWTGIDDDPRLLALAAGRLDAVVQRAIDGDNANAGEVRDEAAIGIGSPLPPGPFDLVVFGDAIARARDPLRFLEQINGLCHAQSVIVCDVPNGSHHGVIERILAGDYTPPASSLQAAPALGLLTPRALVKRFLDAGWLPQLVDCNAYADNSAALPHLVSAAQALGCPPKTAVRNLALDRLVFECKRSPQAAPAVHADAGAGSRSHAAPEARTARAPRLSVIVPVNNALQYELNVAASAGYSELACEHIRVAGATSAGAAFRDGLSRARGEWVLYCHQDVYLPRGSGRMLESLIEELEQDDNPDPVVGFAGLSIDAQGKPRLAGLCIDRLDRFDHPASQAAVSLDECAVLLKRRTQHQIDPALGWHLWATDLCLQAFFKDRRSARIVRIPIFHNSFNDHVHGEPFHESLRRLKAKYPQYGRIATIAAGVV
jgi:SAM-dependent methyltransferase